MVRELNKINNVKICGFLGQCFNCRNKHINLEDILDRPPIWDEGYTTGEASNSVHLNSSQQAQQKQRNTYGAYFKEELKKILDGRETNTDIHTSN